MISIKLSDITMELLPDSEENSLCLADSDRLEQYEKGYWSFVGVVAKVYIKIPFGSDCIGHVVESPGLWGIESDSSEDFLDTVFKDQREILMNMLKHLNVEVVEE